MALKTIMLRQQLETRKASLAQLSQRDAEFAAREAELEQAIGEADCAEDEQAITEAVDGFTGEKEAHEAKKAALEREIADIEKQLDALEDRAAAPLAAPERTGKDVRTNERMISMEHVEIRSLPMSRRAFDALPAERREAIMRQPDVQEFLGQLRGLRSTRAAISGVELTIPVVILDLIAENQFRYSKLMRRVRVRNVNGEARQTIAGTVPEAVWTEMCGAINELTFGFNQISVDGYKVAGYIPVCNSVLEDNDVDLAGWIIEMISEAIGKAKDKAILYGKGAGSKMPLGIVTRLAQQSQPTDYPAVAPPWTDLHTTNIQSISASLKGAEFWSALMLALGNTYTTYSRGEQFWAMNSRTYALLRSKMITFTASGDVAANIFGTLPIITGDVEVLEFIPDGDIIGGYGDLYLWAQRSGMRIDLSTEAQFLQDNTVFRGKERADGMPIVPGAFVAVNINGGTMTTEIPFAADLANFADLDALSVGGYTLSPAFDPDVLSYTVTATNAGDAVEATAASANARVAISYNGRNMRNGGTVTWANGTLPLTVTVQNGNGSRVYTVSVTRTASGG
ncbi:phage major capsid protein [Ruthenibacterium lactatiformans]|uniref:phage major capsid protein n=1 Tax=Ruthenibacterium lactatiformans TaxID=1550024 RepID=UPI00242CE35B|nr:phage major capsid protein [Ruthenibacterium lactatiformans]